ERVVVYYWFTQRGNFYALQGPYSCMRYPEAPLKIRDKELNVSSIVSGWVLLGNEAFVV
ncbi:hypothetical protein L9F63_008259, partial [Diploptera punctata]